VSCMTKHDRFLSFGLAAALVLAGAMCAAVIGGGAGQILAMALIGIGLVLATSLVFLEVGLSEDRERAREPRPRPGNPAGRASRAPRRSLERSRGHRHRLR
jgi:hypothetical protein